MSIGIETAVRDVAGEAPPLHRGKSWCENQKYETAEEEEKRFHCSPHGGKLTAKSVYILSISMYFYQKQYLRPPFDISKMIHDYFFKLKDFITTLAKILPFLTGECLSLITLLVGVKN